MSWDNNSGGSGGGSGGPWGQGPKGPRGPKGPVGGGSGGGGNPPSLEELLKSGREQFKGDLPGGKWLFLIGALIAIAFWIMQSVYTVEAQEVGVEIVFGEPKQELSRPGLHFIFWPVERVEKVVITENQTKVSSISSGRVSDEEGLMLTQDQNIVDVAFSIIWRVADPAAYLFNVRDPADMVRKVSESAMREVVGRRLADEVFRDDRAGFALEVKEIAQQMVNDYGVGVTISSISVENVAPPVEVADAFDEVQRAEQDEDRFQEEARQYSATLLGQARGQAAQLREEAAAYKDRVVKEAEGEAARFISVYEEYSKAPEVTRKRLFLETMEEVLATSSKVIMEEGTSSSGVVPYLPLNELRNSTGSN
jgi:membrane protease subunit HflK